MSDGALSQEEIDSLLAGLDGGGGGAGGSGPAPAKAAQGALSPQEIQGFKGLLDATIGPQSQNLSMITGQSVTLDPPAVDVIDREGFLRDSPEEVLAVSVAFTGSLPGDHIFILSKELALRIASLANKDEGLSELDDMAISAVQECVSTLTGTQITVLSERTGNRNIQSAVAAGVFGPKAMANLPSGDIVRATYQVKIGDDAPQPLVELFSMVFVKDVLASLGVKAPAPQPAAAPQAVPQQQMGAMPGMMQQPGMMQGMMPQQQMGAPMMQGYGIQGAPMGGGMYQGNPPNVQSIQFPNLQPQSQPPENGNIGLIMDVYMEMTVELGRTKKPIKEILGMGEGTIIELDKLAGEPVDILVNHKLIARGEVVVIDENFGVRVTEIVSPMERVTDLN